MVPATIILAMLFFQSVHPMPDIEQPEYLIRNFTVQDGLPVNSINNIVQDDDGYLYFSTFDGLVQFDGYSFRVYNTGNTEEMSSNRIQNMIITSDNSIWLIKETGAITRKKGPFFKTWIPTDVRSNVNQMIEHPEMGLWAATNVGIAKFSPDEERFQLIEDTLLATQFQVIRAGFDNKILIANPNGLLSFDGVSTRKLLDQRDYPNPAMRIIEIRQHDNDYIWVLGTHEFFRFNLETNKVDVAYNVPQEMYFWNIIPSDANEFIVSTRSGLYTFDNSDLSLNRIKADNVVGANRSKLIYDTIDGDEVWVDNSHLYINGRIVLTTSNIRMALIDREESIWLATNTEGVFQVKKGNFVNLTNETVPGLLNTYPIVQSTNGNIWAGSFINGVFRFDETEVANWTPKNSNLTSEIVHYLFADTDGSVFAATDGLWRFENDSWEYLHELETLMRGEPTVQAMYRQGERLFFGSSQPLAVYEDGVYRFFSDSWSVELSRIRVIREDADGNLWFGTNGHGISRYSDGSLITFSSEKNILSSNMVRDIFVQSVDTIWVATQDRGLNRLILQPDGRLLSKKNITTTDGLIHNSLHRIIEDPFGYLWISSNGGIMRVEKNHLNDFADGNTPLLEILGFDESDGMINREANGGVESAGLLDRDNLLWFPNQRGITIIDPSKIKSVEIVQLTPVIESIKISNTKTVYADQSQLNLPKGERNFRIAFTAPNFANPDRVEFRYKLENVHENWQNGTSSREAVLTNVPPGIHEFQLKVQLVSGEPVVKSVFISVPPYFYESGWFRILLIFGGLALVWSGIKYRTKALQIREKQLKKRVDDQTEELKKADEQKTQFFTGITHELKTPLSLILGPLDDILEENKPEKWQETRKRLRMMQRNGYRLKNLVEQILDVSKLNAKAIRLTHQPVRLDKLTLQIAGQFQSTLQQKEIKLIIQFDDFSDAKVYINFEAWERIIINLMSNAIKFSPKKSVITLALNNHDDKIQFSIKDHGSGIAYKNHKKVFEYLYQAEGEHVAEGTGIGLFLVKGLIEHIGGEIELFSDVGAGAEFVITLKKGFKHFKSTDTILHDEHDFFALTPPDILEKSDDDPQSSQNDAAKILVVEDNSDFRVYLKSVIGGKYTPILAEDGQAALEILKTQAPDLIISDVMMPGMNGLEFVNTLRKNEHFKHLPVIFLSAKNQEVDVETGLSTGADIYLTKPIRSKMLLTQIAAVLRREEVLKSGMFTNRSTLGESDLVMKIREIIYRQLANPYLSVSMIADTMFMSRTKLYGEWNKVSEISINDFIIKLRFDEAKILLQQQHFSVQETANAVGFPDANYFSNSFKKKFGYSPSKLSGNKM